MVFLLLATIGFIWGWQSHAYSPRERDPLISFLVTVFRTWRVSRGGRYWPVLASDPDHRVQWVLVSTPVLWVLFRDWLWLTAAADPSE